MNLSCVRKGTGVAGRDALLVSWASRSIFSSPVSKGRCPDVGNSTQSLIVVSLVLSRLQKDPHHMAWSWSSRGRVSLRRSRMNLSTIVKDFSFPGPNPSESCKAKSLFPCEVNSFSISTLSDVQSATILVNSQPG